MKKILFPLSFLILLTGCIISNNPLLVSINITPSTISIASGGITQQFTAIGTYTDATTQNITSSVTWTSGTATVATINTTGLATSVGMGTSTITATSGTISGSTTLIVTTTVASWTRLSGASSGGSSSSGNVSTYGYGIAVDSSGNSYVAGVTDGNLDGQTLSGLNDVFVIKYDFSGAKQWTKLSGVSGASTFGEGITVDSSGNSYVTGYTNGNLDGQTFTGSLDAFVIKYDSNGTKLWTRLIGNLGDTLGEGITVDSSGNIYVTGGTTGDLDGQTATAIGYSNLFVIKYDSNGTKLWTKLLGVYSAYAIGNSIAVDSSGNSYVTGFTNGNLDGQTLIGISGVFIIKYDPNGTKQWTKLSGGISSTSTIGTIGNSIAVDSSGNSYITGYTDTDLDGQALIGLYDVFVIKYDSNGTKLWTMLSGASGTSALGANISTIGEGIAVDSSGNSYVTGFTNGNLDGQILSGFGDVFVIKYDSNGTKLWTRLLGGKSDVTAYGYGIAVDLSGNNYVTGITNGNIDGQTFIGTTADTDVFVTTRLNH